MNPNDIWARPPLPTVGDGSSREAIYTNVGRALSEWENFETHLAILFAYLLGLDEYSHPAARAYGAIASFNGRADVLLAAADAYFLNHPADDMEALLKDSMVIARRAAARRNDIAHGTVLAYPLLRSNVKPFGYFLVPGTYISNRVDVWGETAYAYSAADVERFSDQFTKLSGGQLEVMLHVQGLHLAQRGGRVPPSKPKTRIPKAPKGQTRQQQSSRE